jgi:hypothetical protein
MSELAAATYAILSTIRAGKLDVLEGLDPSLIYSGDARQIVSHSLALDPATVNGDAVAAIAEKLPGGLAQFNRVLAAAEKAARDETAGDTFLPVVRAIDVIRYEAINRRRRALVGAMLNACKQGGDAFDEARQAFDVFMDEQSARTSEAFSLSLDEARERCSDAIEWLVQGVIARSACGFLGANPKQGKTWLVLALSIAGAIGGEWLGRSVRKCRTLYLAGEGGLSQLVNRLDMLCNGLGINTRDLEPWIRIRPSAVQLDTPSGLSALRADIRRHHPGLVIVDPLARFHTQDENRAQEIDPILSELRRIADGEKCAFLITHHCSKSSGRDGGQFDPLRGSSALRGFADFILGLKPLSETPSQVVSEFRDASPLPANLTVQVVISELGNSATVELGETEGEVKRANKAFKILDALRESNDGLKTRDLALAAGVSGTTLSSRLNELVNSGHVEKIPNGKAILWRLKKVDNNDFMEY